MMMTTLTTWLIVLPGQLRSFRAVFVLAHGTTLCLVAHRAGCPLCAAPCDILCALIYLRKRFPKRFHFVLQSALLCFTLCFALVAHGHKEANAAFVLPTAVHNPARNPLFPSGKENPFGHCGFIQAEQKSSTMGSVASCSGKEATDIHDNLDALSRSSGPEQESAKSTTIVQKRRGEKNSHQALYFQNVSAMFIKSPPLCFPVLICLV